MTPTPEQNAKRVIELDENPDAQGNVSLFASSELMEQKLVCFYSAAPELARAYLELETELQQLRLAADGMRLELEFMVKHRGKALMPYDGPRIERAISAYRAAGEGATILAPQ